MTRRVISRWLTGIAAVVALLAVGLATPAQAATRGLGTPTGDTAQASAENARVGAEVAAGNPAIKPVAQQHGWKYKTYQATACYGYKHPFWGKNRDSAGCDVAHFSLSGEVAYNGKQAWGQWISYGAGHAYGVSVTKKWLGYWNNGAVRSPYFMDLGANGNVSVKFFGSNDFYIRIDVHPNGAAGLRGGAA